MTARDQILGRLRAAIGKRPEDQARQAVSNRLAARRPNLIPQAAKVSGAARLEQFRAKAEAAGATIAHIERIQALPASVGAYLHGRNPSPGPVVIAPHPLLDDLPWEQTMGQDFRHDRAYAEDSVGITVADVALAETGTLMFLSGPMMPATLHFVPETEIVALPAAAVVGGMEDAWAYLRLKGQGEMPRAVHLVTGPSRTADIELTLTMGAHGPKHLHVILIGA